MPLLSVLILSIPSREHLLQRLLDVLNPQLHGAVQLIVMHNEGEMSIGELRNECLDAAHGDYVAFIDDDDLIASDYVSLILSAIEEDHPDCIGFRGRHFTNGKLIGHYIWSAQFCRYEAENQPDGLQLMKRSPNHLNPIKRSIAIKAGYPHLNSGEDYQFAQRVYPLIETETFIDEPLYDYCYRSDKSGEMNNAERLRRR
jgi:glycosyltransferase involved in cell wall biosynthesis